MSRRGILLSPDYIAPKMLLDYLGMIEDAGFEMVVIPEFWGRDAFTFISQALQVTSKLKFATGIVNIFSRSPSVLAQTAAALDELSDGRFILGIGASGPIVIQDFHGIPFKKPLQRTRETIQIIRQLFSGERLDHKGEFFEVERFKLMIKPEHEIPIYNAAIGPKNLELTGELADGVFLIWTPLSKIDQILSPLAQGLMKSNRTREELTIAPFLISCASEKSEMTTELTKKHLAYYIGRMGTFYYDLTKRMGYAEEAENVRRLYNQDRDAAAKSITDRMIKDISITGTIDEAKSQIAKWDKVVDIPLISVPYRTPIEMIFETLQAFAP